MCYNPRQLLLFLLLFVVVVVVVVIYLVFVVVVVTFYIFVAKLSLAQAQAGLSSIIINVKPSIWKSIISMLGPCWAVAWLAGSYFSG